MKFRMCKITKQLKTVLGAVAIAGAVAAAPVSAYCDALSQPLKRASFVPLSMPLPIANAARVTLRTAHLWIVGCDSFSRTSSSAETNSYEWKHSRIAPPTLVCSTPRAHRTGACFYRNTRFHGCP